MFFFFILAGIYEIFCKEVFGVKAKNLEFGLQPYKIPETETVCGNSNSIVLKIYCMLNHINNNPHSIFPFI